MPGSVFLEGEKVNLRTIEEEDLEFLRDNINNPEVRTHLTIDKPVNLEQEKEFFKEIICGEETVNLMICKDKHAVGTISLEPHEKDSEAADIGIWVNPENHKNGYGSEAAKLITRYGFNQLNYHKILARAHGSNKPSHKVWEKLGFEKEGELREQIYRNGDYESVYLFGIIEDEWSQ